MTRDYQGPPTQKFGATGSDAARCKSPNEQPDRSETAIATLPGRERQVAGLAIQTDIMVSRAGKKERILVDERCRVSATPAPA
jgi:hypothetical protein